MSVACAFCDARPATAVRAGRELRKAPEKMKTFWNDSSIRTKVLAAGLGVACIASLGGMLGYVGMTQVDKDFMAAEEVAHNALLASQIDADMSKVLLHTNEYLMHAKPSEFSAAKKYLSKSKEELNLAQKKFKEPGRVAVLEQMKLRLENFEGGLVKLQSVLIDLNKVSGKILNVTGPQLLKDLKVLAGTSARLGDQQTYRSANNAHKQFMLVNLHTAKYVLAHKEDEGNLVKAELAALSGQLQEVSKSMRLQAAQYGNGLTTLKSATETLETFNKDYLKLFDLVHEIDRLRIATLDKAGKEISGWAEQIKESAVEEEQKLIAEVNAQAHFVEWIILGVVLFSFCIAAALAFWFGNTFSRDLRAVANPLRKMSKGDLKFEFVAKERADEIGDMMRAVGVFLEGAKENDRMRAENKAERLAAEKKEKERQRAIQEGVNAIGEGLSRVADGDLTTRVQAELPAEYAKLKEDFNKAIASLEETVGSVAGSSESISSGTTQISVASDDLSRRTEHQAATLEQTAAAVAEITQSVAKSSEGAERAREVVSNSKHEAEKGGEVVNRAIEAMSDIEKSSQEIGDIIGVIDEIAFQTNLLALNAGVEAARAGDAGRGFAVVASEVRALAQRSATAARQIKDLISTSTGQVDQGVKLVRESGEALEHIVSGVKEINDVVSEIATGAQEQAGSLQEVNTAVNQLDKVTQENAAMVEEATAATRTLASQTKDLTHLVSRFRATKSSAPPAVAAASKSTVESFPAPKPVSKPAPAPAPARKAAPKPISVKPGVSNGKATAVKTSAPPMVANGGSGSAPVTFSSGASDAGWEEF